MNNQDFDKHYNQMNKFVSRGITVVFVMWCVGAVLVLSILSGLAYVAVHFLSKVW